MTTTKAKTHADQMAATLKTLAADATNFKQLTLEDLTTPTTEVSAQIGLVTPEVMSKVMTYHHASNRAMSTASKDAYRDDMISGRWAFNGQTLVFDTKGMLIDGQHRGFGLVDAAKAMPGFPGLPFVVVRGVSIKAQETMDAGRKRSVADQLNIGSDAKLGTKIVAALRALYHLGNAGSGGKLGGGKLTNALLHDMARKHKKLADSVSLIHAKGDAELAITVRPAVVAAIHYAATHLVEGMAEKADAFVEVLRTGVPTVGYEGVDPAHRLGQLWAQPKFNGGKKPSENEALKYISLAWNLYSDGKPATDKTFGKVVMVEPIGITKTDVTGEIVDLPVSSQPQTDANGETPEQLAARRKAASDAADKALADKKAAAKAKTKDKAKAEKQAAEVGAKLAAQPEAQPEVQPEATTEVQPA